MKTLIYFKYKNHKKQSNNLKISTKIAYLYKMPLNFMKNFQR